MYPFFSFLPHVLIFLYQKMQRKQGVEQTDIDERWWQRRQKKCRRCGCVLQGEKCCSTTNMGLPGCDLLHPRGTLLSLSAAFMSDHARRKDTCVHKCGGIWKKQKEQAEGGAHVITIRKIHQEIGSSEQTIQVNVFWIRGFLHPRAGKFISVAIKEVKKGRKYVSVLSMQSDCCLSTSLPHSPMMLSCWHLKLQVPSSPACETDSAKT